MLALILHLRFLDNKTALKFYFSVCCSLYFGLKSSFFQNGSKRTEPECFGNELCVFFQNQQIQLTWFSLFLSLFNPNITKSVFYGVFNDTEVVVKRMVERTEKQDSKSAELITENVQNLIFCSSVSDEGFLFDQIKDRIDKKKLWLDLKSSVEPLLLMYFQTEGKWPFPKYYGACGDLIVEEYKGEPLTTFFSSSFEKKIFLSTRLLEMAKLFTFGHSNLSFYFTDYSLDNLVVDSNGNVFLVDLDNVIISNRTAIEGNNSVDRKMHRSEILDDHKYAFSPSDICQHYLSDHNYFSVCKYLLSHTQDGLLNNIPEGIEKHEELLQLLDECSQPKTMSDRFSAGQSLQVLLEEISKDFSWGELF